MARYLVAGVGIAGIAATRALAARGHEVTVYNRHEDEALAALAPLATRTITGESVSEKVLAEIDQVVVSPGFPPHHPLATAARAAGIEVYSEPELAWRLRGPNAAPWLAVTGTNGKTTVVSMLVSMLRAAGLRTAALGNIGEPLVDAVEGDYDVLAVELSSQQLHWSSTLSPQVGVLLNLADDHLSWHGDATSYAEAKTAVWRGEYNVGNVDDPAVGRLLAAAGGKHIGFTLRAPAAGEFGLHEGMLVDNTGPRPLPLCAASEVRPAGIHNVANALAAAAVARAYGVSATDVATGLRDYERQPHRNDEVAIVDDVRYVDDSKGTNPHATSAAIEGYERIVWIAGGQLKGVDVNELVATAAPRLSGAVLLGTDRAEIAAALRRHAPGLPVRDVPDTDPGTAMDNAVGAARELASPGDVVLLSPAAASYDMFTGYADRGTRFAAAVTRMSQTENRAGR